MKERILKFAEEGLVRYLGVSERKAREYIEESTIIESIDRAPDIIAAYSQEQLVAEIMRTAIENLGDADGTVCAHECGKILYKTITPFSYDM